MPSQKLTGPFIKNYSLDEGRVEISDTLKPGLSLRISPTSKVFVFRYRVHGKSKRYTIGKYPLVSLSKARSKADELYIQTKQEMDPQQEKIDSRRYSPSTIEDLAETFKTRHLPTLKKSTQDDYRRRIDNEIIPAIGDIPINELSRIEIIEFLEGIAYERGKDKSGAPIQSNRVRAILSSMYSFGMTKALCEFNPVSTVKPIAEEKSRNRVYSEEEIKRLWSAFEIEKYPYNYLFKMLLLTGQRLGETRRMKWKDIKTDTWIIPESETKAKREHHVPLSSYALELLKEIRTIEGSADYVFESPVSKNAPVSWAQKAAGRVGKTSMVSDFRIHDLRRTSASFMAKIGVSRTVLGKVLNHKGLAGDSRVTAIYDRHEYLEEKKLALENWAIHLNGILSGAKQHSKVFRIGR